MPVQLEQIQFPNGEVLAIKARWLALVLGLALLGPSVRGPAQGTASWERFYYEWLIKTDPQGNVEE